MLEVVPDGHFAWQPHPKSMTLGRLVSHLAHLPMFPVMLASGKAEKPPEAAARTELLATLDANIAASRGYLAKLTDEDLAQEVRVTPTITRAS